MPRYELTLNGRDWREVTLAEFIEAERQAGYRPKNCDPSSKKYYSTLATQGFSAAMGPGRSVSGRIVADEDADA